MISREKRQLLSQKLPAGSLVIIAGRNEVLRNGDVYYPFRQDSDFQLLTGLNVPELLLVGRKDQNETQWILYSEPLSEKELLWGTNRLEANELRQISGIEDIRPRTGSVEEILSYKKSNDIVFIRDTSTQSLEDMELIRELRIHTEQTSSLSELLRPLRMYKTEEEVSAIREAVHITHEAYKLLKNIIKPGIAEYELEAAIAGVYRSHKSTESYPTIVASGPNSCTMHYARHDRRLTENDLVLIDFGAEYACYSADVTRTFFTGEPTRRQKEVYEGTKRVKDFAMSLLGKVHSRTQHELQVRDFLVEELKSLGLLAKEISGEEAKIASRKYLPYRSLNHHLGLDTHDVGSKDDLIAPGMVLTCEPGIYIPEEGIGIRLEDDLYITPDGYQNLSEEIPL